jgi:hypothetical protein
MPFPFCGSMPIHYISKHNYEMQNLCKIYNFISEQNIFLNFKYLEQLHTLKLMHNIDFIIFNINLQAELSPAMPVMSRPMPVAVVPHPATSEQYPRAFYPEIVRTRSYHDRFGQRWRRGRCGPYDARHFGGGNLGRRVDHKVDDPVTDTRILQSDNVLCGKVINRTGVANLTDDEIVTDPGLCQRLDVHLRQRLTLFDPFQGLRGLRPQPRLLFLVHTVSDEAANDCAHGRPDEPAGSMMPPRSGADDRASGPAGQGSGGSIVRASLGGIAARYRYCKNCNQQQMSILFHNLFLHKIICHHVVFSIKISENVFQNLTLMHGIEKKDFKWGSKK